MRLVLRNLEEIALLESEADSEAEANARWSLVHFYQRLVMSGKLLPDVEPEFYGCFESVYGGSERAASVSWA